MITGDVGISPASASAITGFELNMDPANQYATSPQVTGKIYAADYAPPTPENLKSAVDDMTRAFKDASKRKADTKDLNGGDLGGMVINPGVYRFDDTVLIPDDITLDGDVTDVWIFKLSDDLVMSTNTQIMLSGGATANNVFWQVDGLVDIGEGAYFVGNLMVKDDITLRTGATVEGRLLGQDKVSLDAASVLAPVK